MFFKHSLTFSIKDLADIAYRKVNHNSNKDISLNTALILGSTSYIILTFIIYPNPLFILTFDSILLTFI
jgi:hypothetical protein